MARPAPTIPVSAKIYRHFAVITVGITACLAIFADGENREAIEDKIAAHQQKAELRQAEAQFAATGKKMKTSRQGMHFTNKKRVTGSFGRDGPDRLVQNEGEFIAVDAELGPNAVPGARYDPGAGAPIPPSVGASPEEVMEYQQKMDQWRRRKQPNRAALDRMIAASRARAHDN